MSRGRREAFEFLGKGWHPTTHGHKMEGTGTNGAYEPKGRTKYKYITLAEAYDSFPGAEANFYGIVAEWTVPRPTRKGTDRYQVLKLRAVLKARRTPMRTCWWT